MTRQQAGEFFGFSLCGVTILLIAHAGLRALGHLALWLSN